MTVGFADIMETMVVGVGVIAAACMSDAVTIGTERPVTIGTERPVTKRRWLQGSCILYCCLNVVVDGCFGFWSEVEKERKKNRPDLETLCQLEIRISEKFE